MSISSTYTFTGGFYGSGVRSCGCPMNLNCVHLIAAQQMPNASYVYWSDKWPSDYGVTLANARRKGKHPVSYHERGLYEGFIVNPETGEISTGPVHVLAAGEEQAKMELARNLPEDVPVEDYDFIVNYLGSVRAKK